MKRFLSIFFIFSLLLSLFSCNNDEGTTRQIYAMNTAMSLQAFGNNQIKAVDEAVNKINAIEKNISRTIETSDISKLNTANGTPIPVSEDTLNIVNEALDFGKKTDGALNITILPIVLLWNILGDNPKVPQDSDIKEALKRINFNNIGLNASNITLKNGTTIDLGALGKGYASQKAYEIFKENNIKSGLINLGGNIAVVGKKPNNEPWKVGIRDPQKEANDYVGYIQAQDKFIISSGDYERFFTENGKRYHHIFDPKTGYPADNTLRSVTIICDNGVKGDALSTALFVMGLEKALKYYNENKDFEALFITKDGKIIGTKGLQNAFTLTAKDGYTYETA